MTYKFLSLLFFCGVCISVFGQELQSPQINQNAIFANPGLAGSKGQTRVCVNFGRINFAKSSESYHRHITNGLISIDGLAFKKSIGVGGYIKFNNYDYYGQWNYYYDSTRTVHTKDHLYDLNYSAIETGIMIAPKFYLASNKTDKQNRCISPSLSIGVRSNFASLNSEFNYVNTSYAPLDSSSKVDEKYSSIELSHITLGLLYNTSKGYCGIKQSFNHVDEMGYIYKTSFVFAHTYCNRKVENPKFAFNPQFYFGILYPFNYYYNHEKITSPYHVYWESDFSVNLDFRYRFIIWGVYCYSSNWNYSSAGYTLGVQFNSMRIILNTRPSFSKTYNDPQFFLTTNFYLKAKKERYR